MSDTPSPLGIYPDEHVAVFIDGPNLYSAAKNAGIEMDYKKLLAHLKDESRLVRAYYYTAMKESGDGDDFVPIRPLIDFLAYNGYTTVTKPMREYTDGETGARRHKGSMNVEITADVLELIHNKPMDHIVLFSGDSDFRRLIEIVQSKGVRVTVVSSMNGGNSMISDDLRRQADTFIDLDKLKAVVSRTDRPDRVFAAR